MSDPTRPVELSLELVSELSADLESSFGPYLATVAARNAALPLPSGHAPAALSKLA